MCILAYDGDGCGKKVGRAIMANDEKALGEISAKIDLGHEIVNHWIADHGGSRISGGGDEGTFQVPKEALGEVESLRKDHEYATGITISIGIGENLSEAGRALLAAKFRGKDQIAQYNDSVEDDIKKARKRVKKGKASQEEYKLAEAYLEKKEEDMSDKTQENEECQYCNDTDGVDPKHCKYCHDLDTKEGQDDCPYCKEAEAEEDCPYCKEADENADCPYCKESEEAPKEEAKEEVPAGEGQANPGDATIANDTPETPIEPPSAEGQEVESGQAIIPEEGAHSKEALQAIAQQIESETADGKPDEKQMADKIDDTEVVGTEMEGNTSRPANFDSNSPGDMGIGGEDTTSEPAEESPDLSSVLQEGLDSNAEDIKKEKVRTMIGQALQGFKASKSVLESAKDQAPEFYAASIAMLAAMIHMAEMLGLKGNGEAPMEQEDNEWKNPFPVHPDKGGEPKPSHAAATEDAAPAPKTDRQ